MFKWTIDTNVQQIHEKKNATIVENSTIVPLKMKPKLGHDSAITLLHAYILISLLRQRLHAHAYYCTAYSTAHWAAQL